MEVAAAEVWQGTTTRVQAHHGDEENRHREWQRASFTTLKAKVATAVMTVVGREAYFVGDCEGGTQIHGRAEMMMAAASACSSMSMDVSTSTLMSTSLSLHWVLLLQPGHLESTARHPRAYQDRHLHPPVG
ncbi:hypothetical protein PR202_ga12588 [Eleusine coracana subsp. coracana]|uniref:Uncharacterized protein n=1 Tax=Eleusine coracana subsp. coracana TaxID=191504 RepID=A0AAV5CCI8_ELECO|nr:hypothetical protein PR202_ga12588 [Eleusine coracana subsp. coracana]